MMLSGGARLDAAVENMGVNSIRLYTGVPAKWIRYIYEQYGSNHAQSLLRPLRTYA